MTPPPAEGEGEARRRTRKTAVLVGGMAVAVVVLAVGVGAYFYAGPRDEQRREARFPTYWSQIEEGETTKSELRGRLGRPQRIEGECWIYTRLIERQQYRFCFSGDTLVQKAAY